MEIEGVSIRKMQEYLIGLIDKSETERRMVANQETESPYEETMKVDTLQRIESDIQMLRTIAVATARLDSITRMATDYGIVQDEFPFIEKHVRENPEDGE
jgi:hypothetical protein